MRSRTRSVRRTGLVLLLLLLGLARVPIAAAAQAGPAPLQLLDVPFLSQSELLCGGAAAAMVLRYWGARDLAPESFAHLVDRRRQGIETAALVRELVDRGWMAVPVRGTASLVDRELAAGRPVLALIEDRPDVYHYIVIVGATTAAIVFHDPARIPFRVLARDAFERRWAPADRWMAVVTPPPGGVGGETASVSPPAATVPRGPAAGAADRCETLVGDGVRLAQAGSLADAEATLASALSCGGSAPLRELAGVRVLQQRWPDATDLAAAAVRADPSDAFAWRLLATGRFLQDERAQALDAWNAIGEPTVDLVQVAGLTRTRSRVVERASGIEPGGVLTLPVLRRAQRQVAEVPSLLASNLTYVPVPGGRAEVRATVSERPLLPASLLGLATVGIGAAVLREVAVPFGSVTGGGDRISAAWRFWPGRPRVAVEISAPTGWERLPSVWSVSALHERQPFDAPALATTERLGGRLSLASWIGPGLRLGIRGGLEEWRGRGRFGMAGAGVRLVSGGERAIGQLDVDTWSGDGRFATMYGLARLRSSTRRQGLLVTGTAGAGMVAPATPPDLWFAGDTGPARPILLRAHPIAVDGRFRAARLGRATVHGSSEVQRWWGGPLVRLGGALFTDAVALAKRVEPGVLVDLDVGAGFRASLAATGGVLRVDLAKGLRDGATRLSVVYEP